MKKLLSVVLALMMSTSAFAGNVTFFSQDDDLCVAVSEKNWIYNKWAIGAAVGVLWVATLLIVSKVSFDGGKQTVERYYRHQNDHLSAQYNQLSNAFADFVHTVNEFRVALFQAFGEDDVAFIDRILRR
jgi:hypothetical protein